MRTEHSEPELSQQFVVLEQRHPALRAAIGNVGGSTLDEETASSGRLESLFQRIPLSVRMVLVLFSSILLTASPCLLAYFFGLFHPYEYPLNIYIPKGSTRFWMEVFRWTLLLEVIVVGSVMAKYLPMLLAKLVAILAKKGRRYLPLGVSALLEMLCFTCRYLCHSITTALLWILACLILPYPNYMLLEHGNVSESYYWSQLPWQFYVERLFLIVCITTLLVMLEKVLLHVISKEFNRSLYRDRIQKSLYSLWTIDILKKAATVFDYCHVPSSTLPTSCKNGGDHGWRPRSCPYHSDDLLTVFMLEHFVDLGKRSGTQKQTMAKRLFHFLLGPDQDRTHLKIGDLQPFFAKHEMAGVFAVLDVANAGEISEADFVRAIDGVYRERAALLKILVSNSDVTGRLDQLMLSIVAVILLLLLFPIIGFSPSDALVPLGVSLTPTFVACTLIFGETIKSIFAAIIFLFATHPYDIGDRVYMDRGNFFVRKIGLLSTTFERFDGFVVSYPNSILATKAICNVRRTDFQSQRIEIALPASTPRAIIMDLERELLKFVQAEARDYVSVRSFRHTMLDMNRLVLIMILCHRCNLQEGYPALLRTNKFLFHLKRLINDYGLEYCTTVRTLELNAPGTTDEKGPLPDFTETFNEK